jgi:hypothetical protein
MPGSKSSASKSVSPSVRKRTFTVAEANKTLPLVKRVVADIKKTHDHVLELQTEDETGESPAIESAIQKLRGYVVELEEVGCELKDPQVGLIDFLGRHQGRDVLLCWRLGEERIHFWHELTAGVVGRKPIATLDERK